MRLPIILALPLVAAFATSASAAIIFGNLGATYTNDNGQSGSGSTIVGQETSISGSYSGKAIGFTMGLDAYTVDNLVLRLANVTGTTDVPSISIWTNSGGNPGAVVRTFTNPAFGGAAVTNYVFTPSAPVTLSASTSYFIVVQQLTPYISDATDNEFNWLNGSPTVVPTGIASTALGRFGNTSSNPTTFTSGTSNYNWFQINGTVVSAIPEPSAFAALAGLAGLGLALSRRRRR